MHCTDVTESKKNAIIKQVSAKTYKKSYNSNQEPSLLAVSKVC